MRWMLPLVAAIAASLAPLHTSRAGSVTLADFDLTLCGPDGSPITGTISAMWGSYSAGVFTPFLSATQSPLNTGYFSPQDAELQVVLTQSDNRSVAAGTQVYVSIFAAPGGSGHSTWSSDVPQVVLSDPSWTAPTFGLTTPNLVWTLGSSTVSMPLAQFGGASPTYNYNGGSPPIWCLQGPTPPDNVPPVITLIGPNPQIIFRGTVFSDLRASVTDDVDSPRTISGAGAVNTSVVGLYTLTYIGKELGGDWIAAGIVDAMAKQGPRKEDGERP